MPAGRPTKKTPELIERILERIGTSNKGLQSICKEEGMPAPSQVYSWLAQDPDFQEKYMRARETQADAFFDEIYEIANHTSEDHTPFTGGNVVQRDRLRIDALKWMASKLSPKKYGDKLDIELKSNTIEVIIKE